MSRIGKQPILIPAGITVDVTGSTVNVKGSKGELSYMAPDCIAVQVEDNAVTVSRTDKSRHSAAMFGTARSIINNMVLGVSVGYKKELLIEGGGTIGTALRRVLRSWSWIQRVPRSFSRYRSRRPSCGEDPYRRSAFPRG